MSKNRDIFGDEIEENKDFSAWQDYKPSRYKVGQQVIGNILTITADSVLVDIGSPVDGVLPKREIVDEKGDLKYKIGDKVPCVIKRVSDDSIALKLDGARIRLDEVADLEDAYDREIPVEGLVSEVVKGGFRVILPGQVRAFCPLSQFSLGGNREDYFVNRKLPFMITQWEEGGKNVIVSHKKAIMQETLEKERSFLEQVQLNSVLPAEVVRIEKFGVFVKLKDWELEGLIPLSELSWVKVRLPNEVVKVGDQIDVVFLNYKEDSTGKLLLTFSLKLAQMHMNPWHQAHLKYPVGSVWDGLVEKKEPFGFFVQVAPGVIGLLPKSSYIDLPQHRDIDQLKKGDAIRVVVREVKEDDKKILLGIPSDGEDETVTALTVANPGKLGTLADVFHKSSRKSKK
ncbi:MAG: S1 RNA-binding domain-containing protein [Bdellovibrionaceae bacterium]|nr:S1 RNA-binding domain-containing protein [Pseudobdellovibrionaceae bacterium]MDW8189766.1 S1 RNA-binding domain-containing protein [Pseudobdellovibrionaceae bacterium]